jgi:hypothetical protein
MISRLSSTIDGIPSFSPHPKVPSISVDVSLTYFSFSTEINFVLIIKNIM